VPYAISDCLVLAPPILPTDRHCVHYKFLYYYYYFYIIIISILLLLLLFLYYYYFYIIIIIIMIIIIIIIIYSKSSIVWCMVKCNSKKYIKYWVTLSVTDRLLDLSLLGFFVLFPSLLRFQHPLLTVTCIYNDTYNIYTNDATEFKSELDSVNFCISVKF